MSSVLALVLLVSTTNVALSQTAKATDSSITQPVFRDVAKEPRGLTLYNEKGEVVARCGKKDESFHDCTMESGVTLDDLMNAWVHAYLEVQK